MTDDYLVYMHIFPDGKKYIGISKQKPNKRWQGGKGYMYNKDFWNAVQVCGWNTIQHKIVQSGLDKDTAEMIEADLILQYRSCDPACGYNSSPGYGILPIHSREKISQARAGTRASAETKRKMSARRKGVPKTADHREHISRGHGGRKVLCVETGEVFFSARAAQEAKGIKGNYVIGPCLKGKQSTAGGYHWRYCE